MGSPVVHFEIGCRDKTKTAAFYQSVFDWSTQDTGMAAMIATGSNDGIQGHINSLGHEPHNYVTFYIQVDDIPAYLAKIAKHGGSTLIPQTEVPGMGAFAWFKDPEGTVIGLWKAKAM